MTITLFIFSRVHATLWPTLSVGPSVGRSVGNTLLFLPFDVILSHFSLMVLTTARDCKVLALFFHNWFICVRVYTSVLPFVQFPSAHSVVIGANRFLVCPSLCVDNKKSSLFTTTTIPLTQKTRPDTRLPQSLVGGQGLFLRSLDHLGRSSEAKDRKKQKKVKCDGPTDQRTNGPMDQRTDRWTDKAGCRVA